MLCTTNLKNKYVPVADHTTGMSHFKN